MEILSSRVLLAPVDFDRAVDFYGGTLGLHVYREFGSGDARGVVFFLGGGFLEISRGGDARPRGAVKLWLQVRAIDEVHEHLARAGVTVDEPPRLRPWGLREMQVRDPDGLPLIFVEVPAGHPLRRDPRG